MDQLFQLADHQLGRLMHTSAKSSARIDMKDHFPFILFFNLFPGRYDQNIIYIKLMEVFFPVIDPVLILCLGLFNTALSNIHIRADLIQYLAYILQYFFCIPIFFKIKIQVCDPVILWTIRHNIYKHLCFIFICKRLLVLDLHTLDSHIRKS